MGWVWQRRCQHRLGQHPPPRRGGSLPSVIYPCGKAPRPARGPDDQPHRAARCVTHSYAPSWSSAPSAPRAPERGRACFPRADPVAVLVRYHTPNYYAAVVAWYYVAPGVAVFLIGPIPHQHVADLVRPDGRQSRAPVPPSRVAAFAYGGRPGDRRRGSTSPGQSHREPDPRMADDPRAWTLYRRGDFRRRRVRQDLRLYAPGRAPAPRAGQADNPARRPAALVLEVKGDSCHDIRRMLDRAGPRRRLHRAESRWPAAVESAERNVARFVLARLPRGVPVEVTVRQGERTVWATA